MKELSLILFLSFIVIWGIDAQDLSEKISDDISYELEIDFTGEISTSLDSIFIVSCIIDAKKTNNVKNVILKSGNSPKALKETHFDLTKESKVQKKSGKIKFELGKAGDDLTNIEVFLLDENGGLIKLLKTNKNK